jgi:thiamine-phosphate pyrophosphorylase
MKKSLQLTGIYGIIDEEFSGGCTNLEVASSMLARGVRVIQYREKTKPALYQYQQCLLLRQLTRQAKATFIVNDHVDIAMATDADGVHLGQDDLPLAQARLLLGPEKLIGISTHSSKQAREAVAGGADYIGVGPIFHTQTKDAGSPVGLEYLEYVARNLAVPFVAIGGITEHNLKQVVEKGARCVCMIGDLLGAEDLEAKLDKVQAQMKTIGG